MNVHIINQAEVRQLLPMNECIEVMAQALQTLASGNAILPLRPILWLPEKVGALGMMPSYLGDIKAMGVKVVSVFPGNHGTQYDSHQGAVMLFETEHGQLLAIIDASAITAIRTAATTAVATRLLARPDAHDLAILGAGIQARTHLEAVLLVRPIRRVLIWNRTPARAEALARELDLPDVTVRVVGDLAAAVGEADVISAATMSKDPLIRGAWLKPGQHLDLVGGYREDMREADDAAVARSRIFVDARFTAAAHAGDISQPLAAGLLADADITDTFQLARGERPGRQNEAEITLFKSGGGGHEDLGTAQYLLSRLQEKAGA